MVVIKDEPETDSEELFIQLRNKFLEDLDKNGNYDDYEEEDIEKLRTDDFYCKRFILHKRNNFENAMEMVYESLKWRKSFGVKSVTQQSIPIEFFQAKAVFPYNKDKEDNPIILLLVRYHKRAPEFAKDLRRFVIYWVEQMEAQTNGGQMTVIMSCTGAGISNLDLDLIKFLITLFRSYYPHSLAYILIFEMPWIFNAAWKIIKAWLPEDFVDKIRFVNKTTIRDYVTEENLLVEMGGTDTTEYEPPSAANDINSNTLIKENGPKRVHFSRNSSVSGSLTNGIEDGSFSSRDSTRVLITDDYCILGGILKISPAVNLIISPPIENVSNDVIIKLTCVSETDVTYKVKTNNIESYRVKPSIGVISPGNSVDINVSLYPGFHPQPIDKFLIMAMEMPDPKPSGPLNSLWKNASPDAIADHKLKCTMMKSEDILENEIEKTLKGLNHSLSNIETKIQALSTNQASLNFKQNITMYLIAGISFFCASHILFIDGPSILSAISRFF